MGEDGGPQEEGKELLFYACEYGHAELISFLIHQGTDITGGDCNADGFKGMHIAAR